MSIDLLPGDWFVVNGREFPVRFVATWDGPDSLAFARLATETANTKRSPAIVAGKIGAPVAKLTGLACTPLDPLDPEQRERLQLDTPHEVLQTFVESSGTFYQVILENLKDVLATLSSTLPQPGDFLVVDGYQYPILAVGEWQSMASTRSFAHLATESASTKRTPAMSGGKRGAPVTDLTGLACTPLDPLETRQKDRLQLATPHEVLQTYLIVGTEFAQLFLEDLKTAEADLSATLPQAGDWLIVGSSAYPILAVGEWQDLGNTQSFAHIANLAASTQRPPTMSGGKRTAPVSHLAGLYCTPLDPIDEDTQRRLVLDAPYQALQTFLTDGVQYGHLIIEDAGLTVNFTGTPIGLLLALTREVLA